MTPTEAIEKALRKHMRLRTGDMMSGNEIQDATLIALDALAGAGMAVVSAEDLRVYVVEEMPDFVTYVTAQARLRAALPERTDT
ncbi:hypothetical protein [Streptomyces sp.]|uniref:hypothetical protein n=1 Tax=Streptomyces sp. TaxID=1931 RepID=UPI002F93E585